MKKEQKIIEEKISLIKDDIKKNVLSKYGLEDLHIGEISFTKHKGCAPGFHEVCKSYGLDLNGNPIIICKCIPN